MNPGENRSQSTLTTTLQEIAISLELESCQTLDVEDLINLMRTKSISESAPKLYPTQH